jgi:hypothetical protein
VKSAINPSKLLYPLDGRLQADAKTVRDLLWPRLQRKISSMERRKKGGGKFVSLGFVAPNCWRDFFDSAYPKTPVSGSFVPQGNVADLVGDSPTSSGLFSFRSEICAVPHK